MRLALALLTSSQLPVFIFLLVLEKRTKVREMMKMHGMKTWQYYLVNYLFFFLLYSLSLAFFWIAGILVDLRSDLSSPYSLTPLQVLHPDPLVDPPHLLCRVGVSSDFPRLLPLLLCG